jgi:hypothetical protein
MPNTSAPTGFLRAASLAGILIALPVAADDAALPLVTDRPDQTESAAVVPRGYVQLETGWTHSEQDLKGVSSQTDGFPETLLRIGLSRTLEARVGFDGYRWEEVDDTRIDGVGDTALGVKIGLREERGWRPQVALLAGIRLPTGDSDFSSERFDPAFRFALSNTLTERLSIGYNLGVAWSSELDAGGERDTLSVFVWTVALGFGATERLGSYVELFGEPGLSAGGPPANSVNGGLTYLLKDDFQLDGFVGTGLSNAADGWFAGIGLSYRFG